ncbi:MATE family efflux transporter [Fusibacter ferrireducens]|uniref:Probable multidrug resistance protein NorM n=1 Tax=Fusibacter ferrireducens TaxID=2785058 RepID=A0ABR9ZSN6_9FIRM|nr:MATE family efflux transporter [Fusibacter ferrireducens]MBF4693455.1 polysaccharide biosynthesis C-terminal domain-containing protein [Fusibacter ferrireducens]
MGKKVNLTEGPIQSQLIKLALPLLIGNIIQQLYNTVDTIIVGRYVGENAFAALGVAGTVMNLFIFVIAGGCTGVALIVATLYGKGDYNTLRRELFLSIVLGIACTLSLSIVAITFMPILLKVIHTPLEITAYTRQYLNIIFIGLLATFIYNLLSATMRAIGNTQIALFFLIFAMLLNIFLDLLLVAKLNFGIAGAAWATVISQLLCAGLCQLYILKQLPFLKIRPEDMRFDSSLIHKTAQFAFISALHQSSLYIGKLLVQGAVNSIGFAAISAYTATTRIEGIAQAFGNSGAESISVFVAQNTGAGNRARSISGFKKGLFLLTALGLFISIMMLFNARLLLKLFISNANEEAIALGIRYIQIICCFYFLCFIGSAFVGYFRGSGQVKIPFLGTTLHITIRVILSYVLVSKCALAAVALATGIGWIAVVAFQVIVYSKVHSEMYKD